MAKDAIPALLEIYKTQDAVSGREAFLALGKMKRAAVPALVNELKVGVRFVRWKMANALAQAGPHGEDAVPTLVGALKGL